MPVLFLLPAKTTVPAVDKIEINICLFKYLFLVNFPVVSGGFALLAGTGATFAGFGGATGAAVVTGIIPALGILGKGK